MAGGGGGGGTGGDDSSSCSSSRSSSSLTEEAAIDGRLGDVPMGMHEAGDTGRQLVRIDFRLARNLLDDALCQLCQYFFWNKCHFYKCNTETGSLSYVKRYS